MIDPANVCLFIPANLQKFKRDLFERIGRHIASKGGKVVQGDVNLLLKFPDDVIPIVGCQPEMTPLIADWTKRKRNYIYWDRGYARRVFATWLPRGENGGYYRWHLNSFQMRAIKDVPDDRWRALKTPMAPWRTNGKHIVVACPPATYERFHKIEGWTDRTLRQLALITKRQIVVRDKESKRPLQDDIDGAHCLVTHGSIAAVEAVIMGCPVIVDPSSAAAIVGSTDIKDIEKPRTIYPDREKWVRALAYSQFNETELVDGTLWRLIA